MNTLKTQSLKVYRDFQRLKYRFPQKNQKKIQFNIREICETNKYLIDNKLISSDQVNQLLQQSTNLHSKLMSMYNSNQEVFLSLFKPLSEREEENEKNSNSNEK